MSKPALLILDDEIEVLNALARVLRKDFELYLFSDPLQALALLRTQFIPLILSDMHMPVMDGAEFLEHVAMISPSAKRFILTGNSDINLMVAAVNQGNISHYFTKPWDNTELAATLKESFDLLIEELRNKTLLKQQQEKNAQLSLLNMSMELTLNKNSQKLSLICDKEAKNFSRLRKTFQVFIDLYSTAIVLHTEEKTGHNVRIATHARLLAHQLDCSKLTIFQIYVAGLLYEAGKLALPQSLLQESLQRCTQQQRAQLEQFNLRSAEMLAPLEEMAHVGSIIEHLSEHVNGLGRPQHLSGSDIPLGSRILAIIIDFDNMIIGRSKEKSLPIKAVMTSIKKLANVQYDEQLLSLYCAMLEEMPHAIEGTIEYPVDISHLKEGFFLSQDICNGASAPLLTKGTLIDEHHIEKLVKLVKQRKISATIFVTHQCNIID
ncbi:MAG: response regulator [Psychrobium sp.]|nr:response regulator [Psychrobium sp.]